jgi:hypothetical protein
MSEADHAQDFERSDAPPWLIVALAAGLAATVVLVMIALNLAFARSLVDRPKGPAAPLPPAPRLQVAPKADLARTNAAEAARLEHIDEAMRAVAAEGWRR